MSKLKKLRLKKLRTKLRAKSKSRKKEKKGRKAINNRSEEQ